MKLLIRTDADAEIGVGHVMRCLALAQAVQDRGGAVEFAMERCPAGIEDRLRSEGFGVLRVKGARGSSEDARETCELVAASGASWVVLDGYSFTVEYQAALRPAALRLLVIDDYGHCSTYKTDLLLNQNSSSAAALYVDRAPGVPVLAGPRYALLRREFGEESGNREIPALGRRLLVTLGGGDPKTATLKVLDALSTIPVQGLEVVVVVGSANPRIDEIREGLSKQGYRGRVEVNPPSMPTLMRWADMAVSAGGSTCWELARLGVPTVVIVLCENQKGPAETMSREGAGVNLGPVEGVDGIRLSDVVGGLAASAERRRTMSECGRRLVDGRGAARVVAAMTRLGLRLRAATAEDCRLLWQWANDPVVREWSFKSEPIEWEDHVRWFQGKQNDPKCIHWMALDERSDPVGQVRLEVDGSEAVVNISMDPRHRQKGIGTALIEKACEALDPSLGVRVVHAYIKPENQASLRSFLRAGFERRDSTQIKGSSAVHMTRDLG